MTFSPLQNKLLPAVSSISTSEILVALFPLEKSFVTDHVVHNPRFERRILEHVMAEYDIDLSQPAQPFEKEHILQAILSLPKRTIFESLGLSWNANLVARHAFRTSQGGPSFLAQFSRDEIRFALKFRAARNASQDELTDPDGIIRDGLLCFAAWISDVPEDVRQLIAYACEAQSLSIPELGTMPAAELESRSAFCADWCEQRMAIHVAEQEEDAEESAEVEPA